MQADVSDPTELDLCVLAVLVRDGPMSAYAVRKAFADSPTYAWSASTGSIYPSIQRLIRAAMVVAGAPQDERGRRLLCATEEGRRRFLRWLLELPPAETGPSADRIRTRVQFLGELNTRKRAVFLANAIGATKAALKELEQLERRYKRDGSDWEEIGVGGGVAELRARLGWLRSIASAERR
jgi:DNA-binding PadR family transcriptional regulator